nr:MAG TPA: hypothetical protein [Caudoviricetes sp.]
MIWFQSLLTESTLKVKFYLRDSLKDSLDLFLYLLWSK